MTQRPRATPRREVLRAGAVVFAWAALAGCASLFAKKREADASVVQQGGEVRIPVGQAPWARDGGVGTLAVEVAGLDDKILVFREPSGSLASVSMTCTHLGCDVDFDPAKDHIVCPCHGSEYANDGAVIHGPAKRPLRSFPVRVVGDEIVVRLV